MDHNDINKFGKLIVDAMMLALLWAIIALPISSFTLVRLEPNDDSNVLSEQDERLIKDIEMDYAGSENKSFRPALTVDGTNETSALLD